MIFWTIHLARKIIFVYSELGPKLSYLVQTYKKIFSDFLGAPQTFLPDYKEALVLTPSAAFFYISWKKKEDLNIIQKFTIYLTGQMT